MDEWKKANVHYEGLPEYTHIARIAGGFTVEQLAVDFTRAYTAKYGQIVSLDPAVIHFRNGKRRISKSVNFIRLVKDRSDIFVELEIESNTAGSLGDTIEQNLSSLN